MNAEFYDMKAKAKVTAKVTEKVTYGEGTKTRCDHPWFLLGRRNESLVLHRK